MSDKCPQDTFVYIVNKSKNPLPSYQTSESSGMDLYASLKDDVTLSPGESVLIPTDIFVSIPNGYEFQVRPRSGLAYKSQITVINSPGTIDSDFLGNIGVILINHGKKAFVISNGDRIAQLVLCKLPPRVSWVEVDNLSQVSDVDRGGGFGSTKGHASLE